MEETAGPGQGRTRFDTAPSERYGPGTGMCPLHRPEATMPAELTPPNRTALWSKRSLTTTQLADLCA